MGEQHPIPIARPTAPLVRYLRLDDIVGVHPAVLRMLGGLPPEPNFGLRGVNDAAINDVFEMPRIAVVPVRRGSGYWAWIGVRAYLRLKECDWRGKIMVLDYGPRMTEEKIAYLANKDWVYAPAMTGSCRRTDKAFAQLWDANSRYVCRPVKSGSHRDQSGLKVCAKLRGLDHRRLRADSLSEPSKSTDRPGSATDDHERGDED